MLSWGLWRLPGLSRLWWVSLSVWRLWLRSLWLPLWLRRLLSLSVWSLRLWLSTPGWTSLPARLRSVS